MGELKFQKLTPTQDVDLSGYEEAFHYIFAEDDIRNIAISGAYSSGKSSVVESYKKKHPEKKFMHLSLAHFQALDESNENEPADSDHDEERFLISNGTLYQYVGDKEVYKCPSDEEDFALAYCLNLLPAYYVHKISAYKNASSVPLFIEDGGGITNRIGLYWCEIADNTTYTLNTTHSYSDRRHNNQVNITYIDGHVAPTSQKFREIAVACFKYKDTGISVVDSIPAD